MNITTVLGGTGKNKKADLSRDRTGDLVGYVLTACERRVITTTPTDPGSLK